MYDLKTYSNEYKDIKYQCKNEHNQTLRMYFTRYKSIYERKIRWYITFLITDKRKQKYQDIQ